MPTKKKADKGDGRSRSGSGSKGEPKTVPAGTGEAGAGENTPVTKASEKEETTSASRGPRSTGAEKPRAKRDAPAKASTRPPRRREDPVSAALSDAPLVPTREQIAARAYELFVRSGYQHGHSEEHWLQAERELRRECAAKKQAAGKPRPTFSSF